MRHHIGLVLVIALAVGCSGKKDIPEDEQAPEPSPDVARGEEIIKSVGGKAAEHFRAACANCHGISGKGDGAQAKGMMPGPRNFTDATWQAKVTDEAIRNIIVKGGAAMDMSALMSPAPKEIREDPAALDGLVKIVRLYGPPKASAPPATPSTPTKSEPPTQTKEQGKTTSILKPKPEANTPRKRTASESAKHIYRSECAYCHGPDGAGNGPTSVTLKVKPRSFRSVGWQNHVTDDRIKTAIVSGGAAVGLSPEMPAHKRLEEQPLVLAELVQVIRSMRAY